MTRGRRSFARSIRPLMTLPNRKLAWRMENSGRNRCFYDDTDHRSVYLAVRAELIQRSEAGRRVNRPCKIIDLDASVLCGRHADGVAALFPDKGEESGNAAAQG